MPDKNIKSKLDRFGAHLQTGSDPPQLKPAPVRYQTLAKAVGGKLVSDRAGSYCVINTVYASGYSHGRFRMNRKRHKVLPRSAFTAQGEDGEVKVKKMVFIDTETTGLGGAGVVPFLVGCGSVTSRGFEIRQYLLPDYADEAAMLESLVNEFGSDRTIVSYNGAAFDLPLIRDRMIINRAATDIEYDYHIDLLHSARRIFRRRLKDCSLTNVEERLFGFKRADDIPGYLIPSVYFEWLSEENTDLMMDVVEHNRLDILSLYFLVRYVAEVHTTEGGVLDEVDDLYSLSRVFGRRKETNLVRQVFSKIDALDPSGLADDIVLYHAMNFKRLGDYTAAVPMWQALSPNESKEGYWANLELAKYFEHREKDPARALSYARTAQKICPYGGSHQANLTNRLNRLKTKLKG
ncbi:MAG: ribonuclease H-like domain-containing protein [Candidatus Zixiibacteriota bacterium]|nr:MAG: ribonuclease H-like domain-containing protein [candidate division Zixibacteria bacterium]